MFILIERYIDNLSVEDLNNLALKNNIIFNQTELNFSYDFIKKNWRTILSNHGYFEIEKYKEYYSDENFNKIMNLYKELRIKYSNFL